MDFPGRRGSVFAPRDILKMQSGNRYLGAVLALLFALPAWAETEPRFKIISGDSVFHPTTVIDHDTIYLPVDEIAKLFDAEIVRDDRSDSLLFLLGESRIELPGEGSLLSVDGEIKALSSPLVWKNGKAWVPVDFILEIIQPLYEKGIVWSAADLTLFITDTKPLVVKMEVSFSDQGARTVILFSRKTAYSIQADGRRMVIRLSAPEIRVPFTRRDYEEPSLRKIRYHRTAAGGQVTLQAGRGFDDWVYRVEERPFRLVIDVTRGTGRVLADNLLQSQSPVRERLTRPGEGSGIPGTRLPVPQGQARKEGRWTVVIDPGHGGLETGARGKSGLLEKDLVLDVSLRLRSLLEEDRDLQVILTRNQDTALGLEQRTALANHQKADLFISIHANASERNEARGAETYFLSPYGTDDEARRTAAMENDTLGLGSFSGQENDPLRMILWEMAQVEFLEESSELAESIQDELNRVLRIANRGIKQAPFRVLTGATMPAVLVEIGFMSNAQEEALFHRPDYKEKIAAALSRSIRQFRRNWELRNEGSARRLSLGSPEGQ